MSYHAHHHWCDSHGARWSCHADDCANGPAPCGTCFPHPIDEAETCDRCGKPPATGKYLKLCEACRALIVKQLAEGKFLG